MSERKKSYANQRESYRPRRKKVLTGSNLVLAFIGFLFIFSFSVVITLNLRQLYYFDVKYQQLTYQTGMSEETIKNNYDTLIDYNLLTKGIHKLEFPDFPMSEHGEIHFSEVKRIFIVLQVMAVISGLLFLIGIFRKARRRDYGSLKLTWIITILVPLILGLIAVFRWDLFFIQFHKLFFANNYWIFDPNVDPVIRILPDAFFMHCAFVILGLMAAGAVICALLYRLLGRCSE